MWVSSIELTNVKSFENSGIINLNKRMNILIGPNNAGKSVLIQALYLLQNPSMLTGNDIRRGAREGKIVIGLEDIDEEQYRDAFQSRQFLPKVHITLFNNNSMSRVVINQDGANSNINPLVSMEPQNFIYTFLAKRKVMNYDVSVNSGIQNAITDNFTYLAAKISRIADQHYELNKAYEAACKDIIGFSLSTVAIQNGQIVGQRISKFGHIPITAMGEGIPHLLALI